MRFEIRLGPFWVSASSRGRRSISAPQRFHGTTLDENAREHFRPHNHLIGDDSSDQHDRQLARTTTIVLAEFAGLRSEIVTRTSGLVALILGNLTVVGVVFGIALSHSGNTNVLLLLPLVTPCIGILVIDSYRNFDLLGRYTYRIIRPQLQVEEELKVDGMGLFEWERWVNERQFTVWFAGPFLLVLFVEFLGPPIAVLIYALQHHLHHPHVQVTTLQAWLWWTGAMLTGFLLLYAAGYLAYSIWHSQGSKKTRLSRNGQ